MTTPGPQIPPPDNRPPSQQEQGTSGHGYRPPPGPSPGGELVPTSDERTLACLAHVLGAFVSFIAPLVIFLTRSRRDYAKVQAAQALNFTITVAIAYVVSGLLTLVLIGFVLLPAVAIWSVVMAVIAGVRTYRAEPFTYPLTIPFIEV